MITQLGKQTTLLRQEKRAPFSRQCHPAPGYTDSWTTLGLDFPSSLLLAQCTAYITTEGNPAQELAAVPLSVSSQLGLALRICATRAWLMALTAS